MDPAQPLAAQLRADIVDDRDGYGAVPVNHPVMQAVEKNAANLDIVLTAAHVSNGCCRVHKTLVERVIEAYVVKTAQRNRTRAFLPRRQKVERFVYRPKLERRRHAAHV